MQAGQLFGDLGIAPAPGGLGPPGLMIAGGRRLGQPGLMIAEGRRLGPLGTMVAEGGRGGPHCDGLHPRATDSATSSPTRLRSRADEGVVSSALLCTTPPG